MLYQASIDSVHKAYDGGALTCEQLVHDCLNRIQALDKQGPRLNAVITINENALADARRIDSGGRSGVLRGIPMLLKDNCETADMPTTAGSLSLAGWHTGRDAFIVNKLRQAGAVIVAKANLHEFAVWGETVSSILGQTLNPYDLTRTPGGSSGGTGAGIAAGYALAGIGTDTINSIRSPSSACCLCGIRPTVGLVSRTGIVPYSLTQDTAGPICKTVADAAAVLTAIAGYDPADGGSADRAAVDYTGRVKPDGLSGKRLGVLRSLMGAQAENEPVNTLMRECFAAMRQAGAELIYIDEPIDVDAIVRDVSVHLYDLKRDLDDYFAGFGGSAPVRSLSDIIAGGKYTKNIDENIRAAQGLSASGPEYKQRLEKRQALRELTVSLLDKYRLHSFVYPHQRQLVCKTGGSQRQRNGALASVCGFPAITVPAGFAPSPDAPIGVPAGVEFMGRPFDEGTLIEIAAGLEGARAVRYPPVLKG